VIHCPPGGASPGGGLAGVSNGCRGRVRDVTLHLLVLGIRHNIRGMHYLNVS